MVVTKKAARFCTPAILQASGYTAPSEIPFASGFTFGALAGGGVFLSLPANAMSKSICCALSFFKKKEMPLFEIK